MLDELDRIAPADGDYATRIPAMNVSLRLRSLSRLESDVRNLDTRELFFKEKSVREKTLRIIREYMKPGSSLWLESPRDRDDILCDFTSAAYSCGDYPLMVDCWRRITPGIWKRRFDAGYASDRVFAYEGQTMYTRLPFLLEQARYPKRFAALGEAARLSRAADGTYAVEYVCRDGRLEVFAGGTKIGSAEPGSGAGFAPAWLADPGRSVVRVTLERLRPPVSDGGAPFDADAFIQRVMKMSKNDSACGGKRKE